MKPKPFTEINKMAVTLQNLRHEHFKNNPTKVTYIEGGRNTNIGCKNSN